MGVRVHFLSFFKFFNFFIFPTEIKYLSFFTLSIPLVYSFYNNSINFFNIFSKKKVKMGPPFMHTTLTYHNKIVKNNNK